MLASLSEEEQRTALDGLTDSQCQELLWDWRFWARPKQLAPAGDWSLWIIRAGRGFGKTRSGSGWVHERAMAYAGRWIALVARTPADARDYMVEGPGGLLRNTPPSERPSFEPSKRRLTWPNGSWATIYSDEEPDQLRGFSGDTAWLDEFAKFKNAREGWDNLQFGMRESSTDRPRRLITTTPRPMALLKELEARATTVVVTGTSHENKSNLDPTWYSETILSYEGTRLGRQEVNAEILDDFPGALWTRAMIDDARVNEAPELARVIVAVDPSGTKGETGETANDVGIVVVGAGVDGRSYVLADRTCNLSPEGWGRRVIETCAEFGADRVVAETNFGGAMVEAVLRSIDKNVSFSEVRASRGKIQRAEPVAALYERGMVSHVGLLPGLEDQMMMMTSGGFAGEGSPDRVDALVWGLTDMALNSVPVYPVAPTQIAQEPFRQVPSHWPRGYGMKVEPNRVTVLWSAFDKESDILYIISEHSRSYAEPSANAQAIRARGVWMPGFIETEKASQDEIRQVIDVYRGLGLNVDYSERALEAGISDMHQRISTGRLKAFTTCTGFFQEYRSYRRDDDGDVIGSGLIDCARILCRPSSLARMMVKPALQAGVITRTHVGDRRIGY